MHGYATGKTRKAESDAKRSCGIFKNMSTPSKVFEDYEIKC